MKALSVLPTVSRAAFRATATLLMTGAVAGPFAASAADATSVAPTAMVGSNAVRWFDLPYLIERSANVRVPLLPARDVRMTPADVHIARGAGGDAALVAAGMHFHACCYMTSMLTADLNGDGHADLVTGNGMSVDLSVLLSDGLGGYSEPVNTLLDNFTIFYVVIAAGDVDGDGNTDIVATGINNDEVVILAGDGAGGFSGQSIVTIGSGQSPRAVALADVDEDGNLDIVTANGDSSNVSVLLGDGAGGFAAALNFAGGSYPASMALADVDGDGHLDIVTANADTRDLSMLAGDGSGQFAAPQSLSVGADAEPRAVTVADVTGDGHPDIVTANAALDGSPFPPPELPGTVSILVNDGSGSFAPAVQLSAGSGEGRAESVAVADVTGDGNADIVVSRPNANSAAVLAGDGAGAFAAAATIPTGIGPSPVLVADATGDGHLDVLTANAVGSNISVLPGDGAGGVGFDGNFAAGTYPHSIASADFNEDGRADVVTANAFGDDVSVLLGNGSGSFAADVHYAVGVAPTGIVAGDVNNDGHADVVTADLGGGTVSVLLGDGAGNFAAALEFSIADDFQSPYAVALGDANGDGFLDIATANTNISNDSISFLLGDGTGHFAAAVVYPVGEPGYYSPQGVVFADVTGDDHADIVTANLGSSTLSLLAGDGSGNFAAAVQLATDLGPVVVAAADVTGDGAVDLITVNQTAQSVSILAANGSGGFAATMNYPIYPTQLVQDYMPWPWGMTLGDINGDGMLDIVTANTQNDTVSVLPNDGAGGFGSYFNFDTGAHPGSVAVADVDGDGDLDVVSANRDNNNISVLTNEAPRPDSIFADGFDIVPI